MRRRPVSAIVVALLAALATACVTVPEAEPSPREAPATSDTCPPDARAGAVATIAGQLDAFARDDYAAALGFASDTFQAATDVPTFRSLIERDFPQVASPEAHTVLACEQPVVGVVRVLVVVTGVDGSSQELVYLVVDNGERWGIDGAAPRRRSGGVTA